MLAAGRASVSLLEGSWAWRPEQTETSVWDCRGVLRWSYHRNYALDLESRWDQHGGRGQLLLTTYF